MNDMARQRIVLQTPEMAQIVPEPDGHYLGSGNTRLELDLYRPVAAPTRALPALLFVTGYPDDGFKRATGAAFREMGAYVSWAQLVASHGMVAVNYENRDPVLDAEAVLRHLVANATTLGIDPGRIGIWSCSGNVPNALHLLNRMREQVACAALCYGYTMDLDGAAHVATASGQFGFANPLGAATRDAITPRPTLVVRAGRDAMPGINESIDRFIAAAEGEGVDLSVIDFAEGEHAFDLTQDSDASRDVIRRIVAFLNARL